MGLAGYLSGCFLVLPGWGVRCSRSYREGGHRTSLPIGPATAAKPRKAKRRALTSARNEGGENAPGAIQVFQTTRQGSFSHH